MNIQGHEILYKMLTIKVSGRIISIVNLVHSYMDSPKDSYESTLFSAVNWGWGFPRISRKTYSFFLGGDSSILGTSLLKSLLIDTNRKWLEITISIHFKLVVV